MAATGNSNSWKQFYESLPGEYEGNKKMVSFSKFSSDTSTDKVLKLRSLIEDKDSVFFGVNNGKVSSFSTALPTLEELGLAKPIKLHA
jgi:hypothetical protein